MRRVRPRRGVIVEQLVSNDGSLSVRGYASTGDDFELGYITGPSDRPEAAVYTYLVPIELSDGSIEIHLYVGPYGNPSLDERQPWSVRTDRPNTDTTEQT